MSNTDEFDPMADDAAVQLRTDRDALFSSIIKERNGWYEQSLELSKKLDTARIALKLIATADPMNEIQMRTIASNAWRESRWSSK